MQARQGAAINKMITLQLLWHSLVLIALAAGQMPPREASLCCSGRLEQGPRPGEHAAIEEDCPVRSNEWPGLLLLVHALHRNERVWRCRALYPACHGSEFKAGCALLSIGFDPLPPKTMAVSAEVLSSSPGNGFRERCPSMAKYRRRAVGIVRSRRSASSIYRSFAHSAARRAHQPCPRPLLSGTGRARPGHRALAGGRTNRSGVARGISGSRTGLSAKRRFRLSCEHFEPSFGRRSGRSGIPVCARPGSDLYGTRR